MFKLMLMEFLQLILVVLVIADIGFLFRIEYAALIAYA